MKQFMIPGFNQCRMVYHQEKMGEIAMGGLDFSLIASSIFLDYFTFVTNLQSACDTTLL